MPSSVADKLTKEVKTLFIEQGINIEYDKPDWRLNLPSISEFTFDLVFPNWRDANVNRKSARGAQLKPDWRLQSIIPKGKPKSEGGYILVTVLTPDLPTKIRDIRIKTSDIEPVESVDTPYFHGLVYLIDEELKAEHQQLVPTSSAVVPAPAAAAPAPVAEIEDEEEKERQEEALRKYDEEELKKYEEELLKKYETEPVTPKKEKARQALDAGPAPKLEEVTAEDLARLEEQEQEEQREGMYEQRLQQLLTPEELSNIMKAVHKAFAEDGLGSIQIFDEKGNIVASANSYEEALSNLVHEIEKDISHGTKDAVYIGTKYAMVSIRQNAQNLPFLDASIFELMKNLDLTKLGDRQKLYSLAELAKSGIKSKDFKELAKKSIHETYTDVNAAYMDKTGRITKTKAYKLDDIEKLRNSVSKYY